MNRIKSIDGLRAIAICMVLLGHTSEQMPSFITDNFIFRSLSNGSLGVKVFFVISGYLITKLLLAEKEKQGNINIKYFYLRRIFRIFPVFYLYILTILLLKWFVFSEIFSSYYLVILASLYLWNYKHFFSYSSMPSDNGNWFFGHFWSLSMEEQFYLLWPITFQKLRKERLIQLVTAILIVMPLIRLATYFFMPNSRGQITMMLQTGGDAILTGCLGALLEPKILASKRISFIVNNNLLMFFIVLILFLPIPLLDKRMLGGYNMLIGPTLKNIIILLILFWSINTPSIVSRILNSRPFVQVGVLSYSLYVWQQLFLTTKINSWTNIFPQNLLIVFVVAFFSYYMIEKPILKLKARYKNV
ncbi:acyltransferase family protein [Spirosoma migulaei]